MHNSLKGTGCPGRTKARAPRGLAVKGKAVSLLVESAGQGAGLLSLPRGSTGWRRAQAQPVTERAPSFNLLTRSLLSLQAA